jgi:hypothetical protein
MPAVSDYLTSLEKRGVRLWLEDGQLRYRASIGTLSTEELSRLRVMKTEIVRELSKTSAPRTDEARLEGIRAEGKPTPVHTPLSFQQHWLLTLMQQHPMWPRAQIFAFHLMGQVEPRVLERSLTAILREHDSLRVRIVDTDGQFCQEMDAPCAYRLEVISVEDSFVAEAEQHIRRQTAQLIARVDSSHGPLLYARLLRVTAQEHYFVLVVHRLAADCLAIGQVFRALWLRYGVELTFDAVLPFDARFAESRAPLASLPAPYCDYAIWQQATDVSWQQKHAAYWEEHLADAPRIRWPLDRGAARAADELATLHSSFGRELSARLRELGRQKQCLPSLVVLTAYVIAVSRWCGQQDFVVPFNVAGRHAAHDGVAGYFSHVLYLRVRLDGNEGFGDLLRRVSKEFYRAIFHQDFGRMARRRLDLLQGTFCQWLSWHPAELAGREMYEIPGQFGIAVEPVRFQTAQDFSNVPPGVTNLDVCFFEAAGDISTLLIFSPTVFATTTMEQFMRELRAVAQEMVKSD